MRALLQLSRTSLRLWSVSERKGALWHEFPSRWFTLARADRPTSLEMERERERVHHPTISGEEASVIFLLPRRWWSVRPPSSVPVSSSSLGNPFLLSINSILRLDGRTAQRDFLSGNAAYHRGRRTADAWEWVSNGRGWMTSPVRRP